MEHAFESNYSILRFWIFLLDFEKNVRLDLQARFKKLYSQIEYYTCADSIYLSTALITYTT